MKYLIKDDPQGIISDVISIFVRPWLAMMAIGALGHRLDIHYLYKFNYWNMFLIEIAGVILLRGVSHRLIAEEVK